MSRNTQILHRARPELQLLLYCSRPHISSETASQISRLIDAGIDWREVSRLALHHRLWPLLHWNLETLSPLSIPDGFKSWLHKRFRRNTERTLALTRALLNLLDLFEEHGIVAVAYKGPVLAMSAYQNLALRHSGDLDIVVHKHDVRKTEALLIQAGYRHSLNPVQQDAYFEDFFHYRFIKEEEIVEIHWGFAEKFESFPVTLADFESDLSTLTLAGRQIPVFSPEDSLLLLCVHGGMRHYWEKLVWISDIARMVQVLPDQAWDSVIAQAEEWGLRRLLCLALYLTHELFAVPIPQEVAQLVREDRAVGNLARPLIRRTFQSLDKPGRLQRVMYYFAMRERLSDKVVAATELARRLSRGRLIKP